MSRTREFLLPDRYRPKPFDFVKLFACLLLIRVLAGSMAQAQESAGKGLPALVQGSERLGRNLLLHEHASSPEKNIVLAPLPITVTLAAMDSFAWSEDLGKQLDSTLGWHRGLGLSSAMPQLMVLFEKPKPIPCSPKTKALTNKRFGIDILCPKGTPAGVWVSNTLLYRSGLGIHDPIPDYVRRDMEKEFAFTFIDVGSRTPGTEDLRKRGSLAGTLPKEFSNPSQEKPDDVWINSSMHLKTRWRGNTFSMSTPRSGAFHAFSGLSRETTFLDSELGLYYHAQTSMYEAVTLPADDAYMLIVMPEQGISMRQLEEELASHPEALDAALEKQVGIVTMPVFHMQYDSDLSESIKAMGITQPFLDLRGMINIPKSHLTRLAQKVDIEVDKNGIRANAETVGAIVYGGILAAPKPFHMVIDQPFVFLIRDQISNSLLVIGALMDPEEKP